MTERLAIDEMREAYIDLKQRYAFLYEMALQARLATQGPDIIAWWELGKAGRPRPSVTIVAPPPPREPARIGDLPERVREIVRVVAQERGVSVADIMGFRQTGRIADARQECYRRLRAMPWGGGQPSLLQIGVWLHRDHTTVLHGVKKR